MLEGEKISGMNWHKGVPLILLWITLAARAAVPATNGIGVFENQSDVGKMQKPGLASFDAGKTQYRLTAGGDNIWGTQDAFHYLWRQVSGDLVMTAQVGWEGTGKNPHRKTGWMVRQNLNPDSPYADAVVHGDGLISLQYRLAPGGVTQEVQSLVRAPALVKLERHGNVFTLSVARKGEPFQQAGSVSIVLNDPVFAGLAVCSHDDTVQETALITQLDFQMKGTAKVEERVLESTLETYSIDSGERRIVYRALDHFEAPNWSRDGKYFIYNSHGRLYQLAVGGNHPELIDTGKATRCNNDHGLSPDGKWLVFVSYDKTVKGHPPNQDVALRLMPLEGGKPKIIAKLFGGQGTINVPSWSPDSKKFAFVSYQLVKKEFSH